MYHTEGYVDRTSCFQENHILNFAVEQAGRLCYFWCVYSGLSEAELADIHKWFYREFLFWIGRESVFIRKEFHLLNKKLPVGKIWLVAFVRGQEIFLCGPDIHRVKISSPEQNGQIMVEVTEEPGAGRDDAVVTGKPGAGMDDAIVTGKPGAGKHDAVVTGKPGAGKHDAIVAEDGVLWEQTRLSEHFTTAQLGNRLQYMLVQKMAAGQLKRGYFLLWENTDHMSVSGWRSGRTT